jgi:hypothetical protein
MKCRNPAYNARGLILITVVVQLGAVKIYVAGWRRSGKRKDTIKLSLPPKLLFEFQPPLNSNVLFWRFFLNLTLCMTKLGSGAVFFLLSDNSII